MEHQQSKEKHKYSVTIPTYNERLHIALMVYLVFKHLQGVDFEIIIVDDGTPDGTQQVIKQLQQSKSRMLFYLLETFRFSISLL